MRKLAKIRKDFTRWAKAQQSWNNSPAQLRAWTTPVKTGDGVWMVAGELCLPENYQLTAKYFQSFAAQYTRRKRGIAALQLALEVPSSLIW